MASNIREAVWTVQIEADAQRVWEKICEECSILQWNAQIASCKSSVDDQQRVVRHYTLHPIGDAVPKMVETELQRADAIMTITYMVDIEVLPIDHYVAQILVTPTDTGCEATIRSRFIDTGTGPDAKALVEGFYQIGLETLATLFDD